MKRVKLVLVAILIIVVGAMGITYLNKPKPIAKTSATVIPENDLAFSVLGDVHENIDSFQEAINDLYIINPGMDALILNGDTVDQGLEKQYTSVKNTINKNKDLLPEIIIKNIGNHEFFDYNAGPNSPQQVQTFINRYLEFSGKEKVYHDTWIKGYHFISLGSEDGNSETMNSVTAYISDKQKNWLKEKLAENYQKGKPIFVFLHQPLDTGIKGWIGVEQSQQLKTILSGYSEVILFSSHTHADLNENSVVLNQPFTLVHTGAVHYTLVYNANGEGGRRKEPSYIKGVYVEVNGNKVVVKERDIKGKQWIFTKEISKE